MLLNVARDCETLDQRCRTCRERPSNSLSLPVAQRYSTPLALGRRSSHVSPRSPFSSSASIGDSPASPQDGFVIRLRSAAGCDLALASYVSPLRVGVEQD